MALASRAVGRVGKAATIVALLGIISAALFYGDAVITPALSVLSAVEGIDVATPAFHDFVVPLTVLILMVLFAFQSSGTAKVAALFGPIMAIWFVAIAIPGVMRVASDPGVLWALNPFHGVAFPDASRHDRFVHARRACSLPSPARKRSMPISVISAGCRSSSPGSAWCCRRWRSIIWGRARWSMRIRKRSPIRSFCSIPTGRASRWWCWRRWRP